MDLIWGQSSKPQYPEYKKINIRDQEHDVDVLPPVADMSLLLAGDLRSSRMSRRAKSFGPCPNRVVSSLPYLDRTTIKAYTPSGSCFLFNMEGDEDITIVGGNQSITSTINDDFIDNFIDDFVRFYIPLIDMPVLLPTYIDRYTSYNKTVRANDINLFSMIPVKEAKSNSKYVNQYTHEVMIDKPDQRHLVDSLGHKKKSKPIISLSSIFGPNSTSPFITPPETASTKHSSYQGMVKDVDTVFLVGRRPSEDTRDISATGGSTSSTRLAEICCDMYRDIFEGSQSSNQSLNESIKRSKNICIHDIISTLKGSVKCDKLGRIIDEQPTPHEMLSYNKRMFSIRLMITMFNNNIKHHILPYSSNSVAQGRSWIRQIEKRVYDFIKMEQIYQSISLTPRFLLALTSSNTRSTWLEDAEPWDPKDYLHIHPGFCKEIYLSLTTNKINLPTHTTIRVKPYKSDLDIKFIPLHIKGNKQLLPPSVVIPDNVKVIGVYLLIRRNDRSRVYYELAMVHKNKENWVVDFVRETYPDIKWLHNKPLYHNKVLYKPDIMCCVDGRIIIVEVDEHQHEMYKGEMDRMYWVYNYLLNYPLDEFGCKPRSIVFLRFNPDKYIRFDHTVPTCFINTYEGKCVIDYYMYNEWEHRLMILKQHIDYWMNPVNSPESKVHLSYICYDLKEDDE